MQRLQERAGFGSIFNIASPFEFQSDGSRWTQLAQLEAVVEFYTNLYNPATNTIVHSVWANNAKPLASSDSRYGVIDLQEPEGSSAKVNGNTVQLDTDYDLRNLIVHPPDANNRATGAAAQGNNPAPRLFLYDNLWLESDTARSSHRYRIMGVNNANKTVTLDTDPPNGPALSRSSSRWRINCRPTIVIIDPFGHRQATGTHNAPPEATVVLSGKRATVVAPDPDAAHRMLKLDGAQHLDRINPDFDTIYLPADTVQGPQKPWRTYRITAVDASAAGHTVTVAGLPDFGGGSSPWEIPAGVSGSMPDLHYSLAPPANPPARGTRGFDHYDAMLFIVHRGRVVDWFRWTSMSSRDHGIWPFHDPHVPPQNEANWQQQLSSIGGNQVYFFSSFHSGDSFKNYSFSVTDGRPPVSPALDQVQDASFYFGTPSPPAAANPANPNALAAPSIDANGKTMIRFHRGNFGPDDSGSAGCLVSTLFSLMRTRLVRLYGKDYEDFYGPGAADAEINKLAFNAIDIDRRDQATATAANTQSINLYNLPIINPAGPTTLAAPNWENRLVGTFWLIRPDELAI